MKAGMTDSSRSLKNSPVVGENVLVVPIIPLLFEDAVRYVGGMAK
jgi:hypothetical protein